LDIGSLPRGIILLLCGTFLAAATPCLGAAVLPPGNGAALFGLIRALGAQTTPASAVESLQSELPDSAEARGAQAADTIRADGMQEFLPDTIAVDRVRVALPDTVERMERAWTTEELDSVLAAAAGGAIKEGTSWQRQKNSRVAMLCALLFPGLGQIYNEKPYKAAIVLGAETFYLSSVLLNYRYAARAREERDRHVINTSEWQEHDAWMAEYKERMTDWIWWSAGALLVIVLDAYVDAHLHDMDFELEGKALSDGTGVALVINF
jgi:hypothetical protein